MRIETITRELYKFDELSEESQEKVLESLYDINVNYDWWEFIFYDAEEIGLKLYAFDLDRGNYVKGRFVLPAKKVARKVIKNHGETCETYKDAKSFLAHKNNSEDEFLDDLLHDYKVLLNKEYEHLTSKEGIVETIEINDMEFTKDGKLK